MNSNGNVKTIFICVIRAIRGRPPPRRAPFQSNSNQFKPFQTKKCENAASLISTGALTKPDKTGRKGWGGAKQVVDNQGVTMRRRTPSSGFGCRSNTYSRPSPLRLPHPRSAFPPPVHKPLQGDTNRYKPIQTNPAHLTHLTHLTDLTRLTGAGSAIWQTSFALGTAGRLCDGFSPLWKRPTV